ncbi:putative sugar transferase EpsL [Halomonas sp. THAF5a]|uniref:sugar transferase n=1 Tax=Halomonas sp. THAF5a TaxID=2587844 RepID=UPI001269313D|nr:sugar transferase [Halomonas sp. THAF5a]QFU01521.1 putative sugar transferase EpsL [Halomonas sp. THAF5a]
MRPPAGKRALDVTASLTALVLLAPLLGLLALWVRLDSPGPVLFCQTRLGRKGVPFALYKFRSMVVRESIDQYREAVVEAGRDPRITRAGRWLRVTSLDELPQLWNVLRGEMSLVGPRPLLPEQQAAVPVHLNRRFMVLPGLTGLAQVRGRRGLAWPDQLAADCDYVDAQSLWRDLVILLATVRVVFAAQGVYGGAGSNWRAYLPGEAARRDNEEVPDA